MRTPHWCVLFRSFGILPEAVDADEAEGSLVELLQVLRVTQTSQITSAGVDPQLTASLVANNCHRLPHHLNVVTSERSPLTAVAPWRSGLRGLVDFHEGLKPEFSL